MLAESRRSQLTQINAWMLGQVILLHHNGPNSDEFMRGPWATKAIIIVKAIMRLTVGAIIFAGAMCLDIRPSLAFGDAAWCAMINKGMGEVILDCQYRTFEDCRAGAAADRGFCNLNPAPGPSAAVLATARWRHNKRHAPQH
jgi:uncharacterized protein DUF3551